MSECGPETEEDVTTAAARLEACFRAIHATRMADLPFLNTVLAVDAVATQSYEDRWLAVLVTPWFINLVLFPRAAACPDTPEPVQRVGSTEEIAFPAGRFEFIHAFEPDFGAYSACSLFSPVLEFADQDTARATAVAAIEGILTPAAVAQTKDESNMGMIWRGDLEGAQAAAAADAQAAREAARAEAKDTGLSRRALLTGGQRPGAGA